MRRVTRTMVCILFALGLITLTVGCGSGDATTAGASPTAGASAAAALSKAVAVSTTGPRTTSKASAGNTRAAMGLSQAVIGTHVGRLADLALKMVSAYAGKGGAAKGQYWSQGSFVATDATQSCWYCFDAPATTAGVLSESRLTKPYLRTIAIDTWTHAIRTMLMSNGAVRDGGSSTTVATGMFAVQIGISFLELKPYLSSSTQALWASAMSSMANYLIDGGNTTFYINGNVMLRQTEVFWLTWAVTHERKYYDEYRSEYEFTLEPTQPRWTGYGLRIVTEPTEPFGANGAGYLTESEGDAPGFDPSYTLVQLDTATQLYVLTHNSEFLWLMNMEFNQLRPLVDGSYVLNATNGTRKNDTVAFLTAAPLVLILSGSRPDLASFWLGQLAAVHEQFIQATGYASIGVYSSVTASLGTAMLAVQYPDGILHAGCSAKTPACSDIF